MMKKEEDPILVLVEKEGGRIAALTFELLRAGQALAAKNGKALCACVLGNEVSNLSTELAYYADRVFVLDNPHLADFQVDFHAFALVSLCRAVKPDTILMGHTYDNIELAPKLAYRLGSESVTDCLGIERESESGFLICRKPVYGGNVIAVLQIDAKPHIVTLRPKILDAMKKSDVKGEVVFFHCEHISSLPLTESVAVAVVPGDSVSLDKSEVIVAGGRGINGTEGMEMLGSLVAELRRFFDTVELGASRPVVDAGLLPHSRQIGLTGEKVSPQIYISIAISGAAQHMAGVAGAKKIIAINKNEEAPIFEASDYGVVGQYEHILPPMIKKIKELS